MLVYQRVMLHHTSPASCHATQLPASVPICVLSGSDALGLANQNAKAALYLNTKINQTEWQVAGQRTNKYSQRVM